MDRKPRIAIPEISQNVSNYTQAAEAAGLEPVVISCEEAHLKNQMQQEYMDIREFNLASCDGLLLPGGADIDPLRYGQRDMGCCMCRDALDLLQFSILDAFVKAKKPILGICRGHQVINVYFGGSMVQDLPTAMTHRVVKKGVDRVHSCSAKEGSWLFGLFGASYFVNSAHHQAVDRLGKGLIVDSFCPWDGVIEGMHHETLPVMGVQWHPERTTLAYEREDTVNGLKVFQYFAGACRALMQRDQETEIEYHI